MQLNSSVIFTSLFIPSTTFELCLSDSFALQNTDVINVQIKIKKTLKTLKNVEKIKKKNVCKRLLETKLKKKRL